ncbi:MAG: thioredoxin [Oscillospiraceae bacterium]|nr:thioredoxin [Oscillospiraceae bacterium]
MELKHISQDTFAAEIANYEGAALIDFWADWCMPCKMMAPTFEALAEKRADVKFCKINVDENPALAMQFGIDAIPAFVLVKGGKAIDKAVGVMSEQQLADFLEKNV